MELFHCANTCSDGIVVLLEETEVEYKLRPISLAENQNKSADFLQLNLKGKIPVLVLDDGQVLTQWLSIAVYLASLQPARSLLPSDPISLARVFEVVDYITGTIHALGFSRLARPESFAPSESDFDLVRQRGLEIAGEGIALLEGHLAGRNFVVDHYSVADAALFYIERWAKRRLGNDLPPNCMAHYALMSQRPAVVRALKRLS